MAEERIKSLVVGAAITNDYEIEKRSTGGGAKIFFSSCGERRFVKIRSVTKSDSIREKVQKNKSRENIR